MLFCVEGQELSCFFFRLRRSADLFRELESVVLCDELCAARSTHYETSNRRWVGAHIDDEEETVKEEGAEGEWNKREPMYVRYTTEK